MERVTLRSGTLHLNQITNNFKIQNLMEPKKYDLEERTLKFAIDSRLFLKKLPRNISNIEDAKQYVRSSGSVGANYIEANESLSKKDFCFRIKICRKEAKESCLLGLCLNCYVRRSCLPLV